VNTAPWTRRVWTGL